MAQAEPVKQDVSNVQPAWQDDPPPMEFAMSHATSSDLVFSALRNGYYQNEASIRDARPTGLPASVSSPSWRG